MNDPTVLPVYSGQDLARLDRAALMALMVGDEDRFEEIEPTMPHVRDAPKIGRNDLCPCGSGRKYKRCCLAKDRG